MRKIVASPRTGASAQSAPTGGSQLSNCWRAMSIRSCCAAAMACDIPCSLADTRGQVGQCTSMAVCAVQANISMMDSSEGTASPTRKWSYTCWMSAAVGTAPPLRALARKPQMKSRSAALSAGRSIDPGDVDGCMEPLALGCAHAADCLRRSFGQGSLQVNARRGDIEGF